MSDNISNARDLLRESLSPFFKGKTADSRLSEATEAALASIEHLINTQASSPKKLGATVMTESASANKRVSPRNI
jgi:hypothetical protein